MAGKDEKFRVISGGQTGVDRAALDAARDAGLAVGGWCPKDRWAEDGPIDESYPLRETEGADPAARTKANINEADATLIIVADADPARWGPGTRLTRDEAVRNDKPYFIICLGPEAGSAEVHLASVRSFIATVRPRTLNIAGPRETGAPGIYARARVFLARLFAVL